MRVLTRQVISGIENLPVQGPCLVVFNQASIFDTPLVNALVPRRDVTGLVAWDYRRNLFYRVLIEAGGGLWIRRSSPDRSALRAAQDALDRGWVVEISPEGRRSPTGALVKAKPGPAFLATRAGVPVVPVAFSGTAAIASSLRSLRRPTVTIQVGKPFRVDALCGGANRRDGLREAADRMMCRIAALLPPAERGVYAGHPYLASLEGERR
jgi:1-acyl-sn-glycerol-3-phosphate acyltransferase